MAPSHSCLAPLIIMGKFKLWEEKTFLICIFGSGLFCQRFNYPSDKNGQNEFLSSFLGDIFGLKGGYRWVLAGIIDSNVPASQARQLRTPSAGLATQWHWVIQVLNKKIKESTNCYEDNDWCLERIPKRSYFCSQIQISNTGLKSLVMVKQGS